MFGATYFFFLAPPLEPTFFFYMLKHEYSGADYPLITFLPSIKATLLGPFSSYFFLKPKTIFFGIRIKISVFFFILEFFQNWADQIFHKKNFLRKKFCPCLFLISIAINNIVNKNQYVLQVFFYDKC